MYILYGIRWCIYGRSCFGKPDTVYFLIENELLDQFDQLAKETRIPKSRLFDEAIEDLLKKYAAKDL